MTGGEIEALRGLAYVGIHYWLAMSAQDMASHRGLLDRGLAECAIDGASNAWHWRITGAGVDYWNRVPR